MALMAQVAQMAQMAQMALMAQVALKAQVGPVSLHRSNPRFNPDSIRGWTRRNASRRTVSA